MTPTMAVTTDASHGPGTSSDPLLGTWTTDTVTCDQMNAAWANAGFTRAQLKEYETEMTAVGLDCPTTFQVRFGSGEMLQYQKSELGWEGQYRITGNDMFEGTDSGELGRYRYEIDGDSLTIDVLSYDSPGGLLDFIIQTAIYGSAPFTRVP